MPCLRSSFSFELEITAFCGFLDFMMVSNLIDEFHELEKLDEREADLESRQSYLTKRNW